MTANELQALMVLTTVTSFTPGPNTTLSTALAANGGLSRAFGFIAAVTVGWGLLFTLCAFGVGALVLAVPALRWVVLLGGSGYLLWLARRLWIGRRLNQADLERLGVGFWQGVGLQFLNIKAWMLALSIVAGWIAGRPDAADRFWYVLPVLLAFAFFSNLSYALVGTLLREWLAGPQVGGSATYACLQVFNRVMAALLCVTAGWMWLSEWQTNGWVT